MALDERSVERLAYFFPVTIDHLNDEEFMDKIHDIGGILHRVWGRRYRKIFYTEVLRRMDCPDWLVPICRFILMITPIGVPKKNYLRHLEIINMSDATFYATMGEPPNDKIGFFVRLENHTVGFFSNSMPSLLDNVDRL